jgi:hypothetical protein
MTGLANLVDFLSKRWREIRNRAAVAMLGFCCASHFSRRSDVMESGTRLQRFIRRFFMVAHPWQFRARCPVTVIEGCGHNNSNGSANSSTNASGDTNARHVLSSNG